MEETTPYTGDTTYQEDNDSGRHSVGTSRHSSAVTRPASSSNSVRNQAESYDTPGCEEITRGIADFVSQVAKDSSTWGKRSGGNGGNEQSSDPHFDDVEHTLKKVQLTVDRYSNVWAECRHSMDELTQILESRGAAYRPRPRTAPLPRPPRDRSDLDIVDAKSDQSAAEKDLRVAEFNFRLAQSNRHLAETTAIVVEAEKAHNDAAAITQDATALVEQIQRDRHQQKQEEKEADIQREIRRKEKALEKAAMEAKKRDEEEAAAIAQKEGDRAGKRGSTHGEARGEWVDMDSKVYQIPSGDFDLGVGCVARWRPANNPVTLECTRIDQSESSFRTSVHEELISNVLKIKITSSGINPLKTPVYIALPHCLTRTSAITREAIIKVTSASTLKDEEESKMVDSANIEWKALPTFEVTLDSYKDMKFAQARLDRLECEIVVVSRYKIDLLQLNPRGGRATSTVDSRVTFTSQKHGLKAKELVKVQMHPVESALVSEIRSANPREMYGIYACSSIAELEWSTGQLHKPVTVTLPCPANPAKARKAAEARAAKEQRLNNQQTNYELFLQQEETKKREREEKKQKAAAAAAAATGGNGSGEGGPTPKGHKWYMGTYAANEDDETDDLHLLSWEPKLLWVVQDVKVESLRLDLVTFPLMTSDVRRFMVIRVKQGCELAKVSRMANSVDKNLKTKKATVILKQKKDDPTMAMLQVTPLSKWEKVESLMVMAGYTHGPDKGSDILLREGELLEVNFRGNITAAGCQPMEILYNSQLRNSVEVKLREKDAFPSYYRGFLQLSRKWTETSRPRRIEDDENPQPLTVTKRQLLSELQISIPKTYTPVAPPAMKSIPAVSIPSVDLITANTLDIIAAELGDEWQKVGHHLGVKKVRLQAIIRRTEHHDLTEMEQETQAKYQMLLTWVKRVPRGADKTSILSQAFYRCGRHDLGEKLLRMRKDYSASSHRVHHTR